MKHSISLGKQITASHTDLLVDTPMSDIVAMIRGDKGELREEIRRLHNIKRLDQNAYKRAKTVLPYICGSSFQHQIRKSANFLEANACIIDFDQCASTIEELHTIQKNLAEHPDVWVVYTSPSGKGLKVIIQLESPILDLATYTNFYKQYVVQFAKKMNLSSSLDIQCCDATRVSFLSYDPNVVFNPIPHPVKYSDFLSPILDFNTSNEPAPIEENNSHAPSKDEYAEILAKLNPKYQYLKHKVPPFVPEMLQHIQPVIEEAITPYQIKVLECVPIQYGMKFRFIKGIHIAEINVFYGKRGFSVVVSPKRDTHPQLNELLHKIIFIQLQDIQTTTNQLIHEIKASY